MLPEAPAYWSPLKMASVAAGLSPLSLMDRLAHL